MHGLVKMIPAGGPVSVTLRFAFKQGTMWRYHYSAGGPAPYAGSEADGPERTHELGAPATLDFKIHAWRVALADLGADDALDGTVTLEWWQQVDGQRVVLERQRETYDPAEAGKTSDVVGDEVEFELLPADLLASHE